MENFDFIAHLTDTASALDGSVEAVESYVRCYYQEMHAISAKWSGFGLGEERFDEAFSELNAVHQKYWLTDTRFTEYWQPAIEPPNAYQVSDSGITIFSDILGNFVAMVNTAERTVVYVLCVMRDELKIVDRFFR